MHNIIDKLQELKQAQKEYRKEVAGRNNSKKVNRLKDKIYDLYEEIKEIHKAIPTRTDPQKGNYDVKLN
jgi:hypothetical protein